MSCFNFDFIILLVPTFITRLVNKHTVQISYYLLFSFRKKDLTEIKYVIGGDVSKKAKLFNKYFMK